MRSENNIEKKEGLGKKCTKAAGYMALGVIGVVLLSTVFGYFVMHLWNWLMPEIFGLPMITFFQAFGLILLARLIFGGFKHGPNKGDNKKNHFQRKKDSFFNCSSNEFGKWKHYEEFWAEKGEKEYNEYITNKKKDI